MSLEYEISTENEPEAGISFFERYLTAWVGICIVVGIALGQSFPAVFKAIGAMEIAKVNLPVGLLIWVIRTLMPEQQEPAEYDVHKE